MAVVIEASIYLDGVVKTLGGDSPSFQSTVLFALARTRTVGFEPSQYVKNIQITGKQA